MDVIVFLIAGFFGIKTLLPGIIGPILVHSRQKQPARPEFTSFDPSELDPDIADYFSRSVSAIQDEGFEFLGYTSWSIQDRQRMYFGLLIHREAGDMGMVVYITSGHDKHPVETRYVEFAAEFTVAREINTNNSTQIEVFKKLPERMVFRFPHILSPHQLYLLHRRLKGTYAAAWAPLPPPHGREIQAVHNSIAKEYEKQVRAGYFYLDREEGVYRPTWKGAFLMTWKLIWPFTLFRNILVRRRANRLINELMGEEG